MRKLPRRLHVLWNARIRYYNFYVGIDEWGERMKQIGIFPNTEKDKDFIITKRIIAYLLKQGCVPMIPKAVAPLCGYEEYAVEDSVLFGESDLLISLGGDGTLLGVSRKASMYGRPVMGINLGTLGFLTAEEKGNAEQAIQQVLDGNYKTEERMLLQASISSDNLKTKNVIALNDICISRGVLYKILEVDLYINDEYVETLRADGVVICTPTGSTAYNLSAGGPVLKADAQIIAITPVAAHTLNSRSIVISAEDEVRVEVHPRENASYTVSADGQDTHFVTGASSICIRKAEKSAIIVKTKQQSFYEVLRHKLSQ